MASFGNYDEFRSICLYDIKTSLYLYDIAEAYISMMLTNDDFRQKFKQIDGATS